MGKRGPKNLPVKLRVLEGNKSRKQIGDVIDPKLPPDMPSPPAFLNDYAVREWNRIAPQLYEMGILTDVDRGALSACCQAWGRWMEAEERLAQLAKTDKESGGLTLKTAAGNTIMNPLLTTANAAMRDYIRFMAEFGMSPSARARIQSKRPDEEDPIAKKYFGNR